MVCGPFGPCTFSEGPAPYHLATLVLTHRATLDHMAQWAEGCLTNENGCQEPIPQTNIRSFAGPTTSLSLPIPPQDTQADWGRGNGFLVDVRLYGGRLTGTIQIDIAPQVGGPRSPEPPGNSVCYIVMTGDNNNWSGKWACGVAGTGEVHSFTAVSRRR